MSLDRLNKLYTILQNAPNINEVNLEELNDYKNVSNADLDAFYEVAKNGGSSVKLAYGWLVIAKAVKEKLDTAIESIQLSAESGDMMAEYMLGLSYEYGIGHDVEYRKAFIHYSKAAEKGYMPAEYSVGWFHEHIFFYHNYDLAISWYEKALKHGHSYASHRLNWLKNTGELATNLVSPGQDQLDLNTEGCNYVNEGEYKKAFEAFFRAACTGYSVCIENICILLGKHKIPEADISDALKIVNIYATYNNPKALSFLAACYTIGEYVPKEEKKGAEYCEKAAENGAIECIQSIVQTCLNNKDFNSAFKWVQKGYELGDANCTYNLGLAYCNGQGIAQDLSKGVEILKEAKERGAAELGFPVDGAIEHYAKQSNPAKGGCLGIITGLLIVIGALISIF